MDPALASIIGTTIIGGCSIVVAFITGRATDRKVIAAAVDEATEPLLEENANLKAELAASTGREPDDH